MSKAFFPKKQTMKHLLICVLASIMALSLSAQPTRQVRVMHYNLLSFGPSCPGVSLVEKYGWLGEIVNEVRPDIMTVNEIGDETAFSANIANVSFDYTNTMEFGDQTLAEHNSFIINQIFYNSDLFTYFSEDVITGNIRDINVYTLYVNTTANAPGSDTAFLHCIVAHLKAAQGQANVDQRTAAAQDIMDWVEQNGKADANVLLLGDMNVYSSNEPAFQEFVNHSNPNIRFQDPGGYQNGWGGASNAIAHTQSTRSNSNDCGSGGGMDDRFDMILASSAIMDGTAQVQYVESSYAALGNNGNGYNNTLSCSGNTGVSTDVCLALRRMSDHLPVVLDLEIPGVPTAIGPSLIPGLSLHHYVNNGQSLVNIHSRTPRDLNLQVLDLSGRELIQAGIEARNMAEPVALPGLNPGFYLLRVTDSQGRQALRKIQVQ